MVNKLDRLVLELRMSPTEAYARLQAVVGHCNMIWSGFESERWLSESDAVLALEAAKEAARDAAGRVPAPLSLAQGGRRPARSGKEGALQRPRPPPPCRR
jgi:hypothetical protein